jgi:hypothetical protein
MLDSMYWDADGNPTAEQYPISELMDIGAHQLQSRPKWIFVKEVANRDTRNILLAGLQAKYGKGKIADKVWELKSTSTDPTDKKTFDAVMVCLSL